MGEDDWSDRRKELSMGTEETANLFYRPIATTIDFMIGFFGVGMWIGFSISPEGNITNGAIGLCLFTLCGIHQEVIAGQRKAEAT